MRITPLRKWHCARVIPTVNNFADAIHRLRTFWAWEGDVINKWAMWISCFEILTGKVGELSKRTNAVEMVLRAAPQRQRSAPVTVTRDGPVNVVLKPIAIAAGLDRFRVPICLSILRNELIFNCGGADIPRRLRVIHKWCVAAPAVWVGVLKLQLTEENAS